MPDIAFCRHCGKTIDSTTRSCPHCGAFQLISQREKNRLVAALFAFFLGGFGIHKFYLGKIGQGLLYLLFCWTFIPSLIAFIEGIIYLCNTDEAFSRKYD